MISLNCSFLMRLSNQEFPQAFKEICSLYDEEQIEVLYVKESLIRLKAHEAFLQYVWEMRTPHRLTKVLRMQNKERTDHLVSLRARIKATKKSPIESEREAAQTLYLWINKHRKHIYSQSTIIMERLVDNLQTESKVDVRISSALTELHLSSVLTSIVVLTMDITENVNTRHKENEKNKQKIDKIKRAAYSDMIRFLKSLQTAVNLEDPQGGFYSNFEREIYSRFDKYNARLLARKTRRDNAKLEDENAGVGDNEDVIVKQRMPDNTTTHEGFAKNKMFSIEDEDKKSDISKLVRVTHNGVTNASDQANENHA